MENLDFGRPGRFYKGNIHTHSTSSDGRHPARDVCRAYREEGYDFLVLTDHFLEVYGFGVTDTRPFRTGDFTTIIGAELHAPETEAGEIWHIKAVGLPLDFEALRKDETGPEVARRAFEAGAFIGMVHPTWYGLTQGDAHRLPFAHAVEIYNHGSEIEVDRGYSWAFLDVLLNEGWRLSGYAVDDAHKLVDDWLGGWVMVQAEDNDPNALLASLKAGRYYSSQGPDFHDIAVENGHIDVRCTPARRISIQGKGSRADYVDGDGLTGARFDTWPFRNSWFRVTVTDDAGKQGWSNPYWID